jgi:hypothetical protein
MSSHDFKFMPKLVVGKPMQTHNSPERFWEVYIWDWRGILATAHGATPEEATRIGAALAEKLSEVIANE